MFNSILFLNGSLSFSPFITQWHDKLWIAADGAADKLIEQNYFPQLIVGDGDSFAATPGRLSSEHIVIPDQNTTDFEKCLSVLTERQLFPSLVCGIGGGEIDHVHHNLETFMHYASSHPMLFYDQQAGYPAKLGIPVHHELIVEFHCLHSTVSLLPFPYAKVTSEGLAWPLKEDDLYFLGKSGVRNKNNSLDTKLKVIEGDLLVVLDLAKIKQITWDRVNVPLGSNNKS